MPIALQARKYGRFCFHGKSVRGLVSHLHLIALQAINRANFVFMVSELELEGWCLIYSGQISNPLYWEMVQ